MLFSPLKYSITPIKNSSRRSEDASRPYRGQDARTLLHRGGRKMHFTVDRVRRSLPALLLTAAFLVVCIAAFGQDSQSAALNASSAPPAPLKLDTGDTAWMLVATAFVMLMTPGLALFYGGMVRSKNVLNTIMQSFIALAVVSISSSVATARPRRINPPTFCLTTGTRRTSRAAPSPLPT